MRRHIQLAAAAALTLAAALPALPALAQSNASAGASDTPDLVPVAVWTVVLALLAVLVTSVGYLYRRKQGMDRPLQAPPLDATAGHGSEDETRDAAGHAISGHVLAEHAAAQHDDATEQAQLLHGKAACH
jgi:hypothetical protein